MASYCWGVGGNSKPQIQPLCTSGENNFIKYILAITLLLLEREMLHTGTWKDVVG